MKTLLSILAIIIIFFNSGLYAQNINTDKIELELQKYRIYYGKGGSTTDITPYIIINGKYIEDRAYDKKFFKNTLGDCPKAYNKSKTYLNLQKKSRNIRRIGFWSGLAASAAGLTYVLNNKSLDNRNKLFYSGASLMGGLAVYYVVKLRAKKIRHNAYRELKSGIDYYDKNCYVEAKDFDKPIESKPNSKKKIQKNFKREYVIKMKDLSKTSFLRLNFDFIGLKMGKTSIQLFPGIGLKYFKNGLSLSAGLSVPLVDGENPVWDIKYDNYNIAYPVNTGRAMSGHLEIVYSLFKKIKPMRPHTVLGKSRGIDFSVRSGGGKKIITWGPMFELEFDKSIKMQTILNDIEKDAIFNKSTNSLSIPIYNPIFFQKSTYLSLGINRTLFTSYTLETNDSRFSSKTKSTVLISTYAATKLNLNSTLSSMNYSSVIARDIPITFTDMKYTNLGFAFGISAETKKKYFGLGASIEGGLNPHIDHQDYKDYYGMLKIILVLGWVSK